MDSTQGSIWRHFFWPRVSSSHTPRAFYAAPLAAPSWTSLFGLFLLPRQKYNLELEFLADFHIFCTKFCPDRSELLRSEIHWVYKKLWLFNWTPFPCLWEALPRTNPFYLFAWETGLEQYFWLNFTYFFSGKPPDSIGALGSKIGRIYGL